MNKQNLLELREEGIDITDLKFVDDAIQDYEEEYNEEVISRSKLQLKTEEIIISLRKNKQISKMLELSLRLRPLGSKLRKLENELSELIGFLNLFYVGDEYEYEIYEYYQDKLNETRLLINDYNKVKANKQNKEETKLDTLRKQKVKLMRRNK